MNLCARHDEALVLALELRGLLRPTLVADADVTPLVSARVAIAEHATNLAGRASVEMLATTQCPLCFCQRGIRERHMDGVNLDDWIEHAADEALAREVARQDAPRTSLAGQRSH